MAIITKKIWPEFFEKVASGEKQWELRLGNFKVHPGDTLLLEEWDPKAQKYTGRSLERRVGYVRRFRLDELFWSKEDIEKHGFQIISLE